MLEGDEYVESSALRSLKLSARNSTKDFCRCLATHFREAPVSLVVAWLDRLSRSAAVPAESALMNVRSQSVRGSASANLCLLVSRAREPCAYLLHLFEKIA